MVYCFYLCSLFFCLVSFCVVLSLVLFVIVFCPVLPFTQIPWPLTATTWKQLSTLTSQVSGSVSPYLAARLLRSTSWSLLSCLSLPLELPPPCSSPLPPRTGSVVIPLAHIVLSALPLCLDWFTITLPAVSSQSPVNKLQLSAPLHLGPISCRSLTAVGWERVCDLQRFWPFLNTPTPTPILIYAKHTPNISFFTMYNIEKPQLLKQ